MTNEMRTFQPDSFIKEVEPMATMVASLDPGDEEEEFNVPSGCWLPWANQSSDRFLLIHQLQLEDHGRFEQASTATSLHADSNDQQSLKCSYITLA